MIGGLLASHAAGPNFFFDDRMVLGFALKLAVRSNAIQTRVAHVSEGCAIAVNVKSDDGRRHHGKARMLRRHLMNGTVRALNRQFHQIFRIVAVTKFVTKGFVKYFDGCLGSHLAGFRAADAVGDCKKPARGVSQKRIFVERSFFADAAIANRSDLEFVSRSSSAHCPASSSTFSSTGWRTCLMATTSFAFR